MARHSRGNFSQNLPVRKKVARTLCSASVLRRIGTAFASLPASKVSATRGGISGASRNSVGVGFQNASAALVGLFAGFGAITAGFDMEGGAVGVTGFCCRHPARRSRRRREALAPIPSPTLRERGDCSAGFSFPFHSGTIREEQGS